MIVIIVFQVSNARPEDKIRQEDLTKILASVQSVHSKQENIDARLVALKRWDDEVGPLKTCDVVVNSEIFPPIGKRVSFFLTAACVYVRRILFWTWLGPNVEKLTQKKYVLFF